MRSKLWKSSVTLFLVAQFAISQSGASGYTPMSLYPQIESKARQADPNNRQSIHDLAHEIMISPHIYSIPTPVAGLLEDRLTDAEIRFRNKTGPGVSEEQLVNLMNWMWDKLHLPSYTKTTIEQVRTLRMGLAIQSPYLMGSTLAGKEIKRGDHVRSEMSPLQAMHLLHVMADQKIINPDYQDPTIDVVAAEGNRTRAGAGKPYIIGGGSNPKNLEVRRALSSAISAMNTQDAYDIMDHALKTLKRT